MQLHHDHPVLEAWTTIGNAAGLVLGVGATIGGLRLLRRDPRGLGLTRTFAVATLVYISLGALVSGTFLAPATAADLGGPDPERQTFALVLLITMASSVVFFLAFYSGVLAVLARPGVRARFEGPSARSDDAGGGVES